MLQKSFCGSITLQAGAVILSGVLLSLAGMILAANIFTPNKPVTGFLLMIIFVIGIIVAVYLLFTSAYKEDRSFATGAGIVLGLILVYWLVLCCFSFAGSVADIENVCIYVKCPESLWLARLYYRKVKKKEVKFYPTAKTSTDSTSNTLVTYNTEQSSSNSTIDLPLSKLTNVTSPLRVNKRSAIEYVEAVYKLQIQTTPLPRDVKVTIQKDDKLVKTFLKKLLLKKPEMSLEHKFLHVGLRSIKSLASTNPPNFEYSFSTSGRENKFKAMGSWDEYYEDIDIGWPLLGAVLLFVANLLFILFCVLTAFSWASELRGVDDEDSDEDEVL